MGPANPGPVFLKISDGEAFVKIKEYDPFSCFNSVDIYVGVLC